MELGYLQIINGRAYISKSCLVDNGLNIGTLNNAISRSKLKKNNFYITYRKEGSKKIWVLYQSIPTRVLNKLNLPIDESKFIEFIKNSTPINDSFNSQLDFNLNQVWLNSEYWAGYIPLYRDFFSDAEVINNYARTHAVIEEILMLKKLKLYELKEIHNAYQKLPKVTFKTKAYSYFSNKLIQCKKEGIAESLIHNFRIHGRNPYKINKEVATLIQSFRLNSKRYNKSKILLLVNIYLKNIGYPTISQSSVDRICDDIEFRNKTDILRLGRKFSEDYITPYLSRKSPDYAGGLYQIDSSQINIYYNNDGIPSYLTLCVVLDTFSRKIIGYSIGQIENFKLIKEALKNSFIKGGIAPDQILVDNHTSYHSSEFKILRNKLMSLGVTVRYAKVKNAKDKAHVERWFCTFQSKYLIDIYGFLGEGIKTKREGGRANEEKTNEYRKVKNLHHKNDLAQLIEEKIIEYNQTVHSVTKEVPEISFKISAKESKRTINKYDVALVFGLTKSIKVKKSKIIMTVLGTRYSYTIWDIHLANKVNRTKVKVHYDEFDLSKVFISSLDGKTKGIVQRDLDVNIVPMNNLEAKVYQSHNLRNLRNIKQNLKDVYKDIKKGYKKIETIPILGLEEDIDMKLLKVRNENLNDIEKELISLKIINSISSNSAYDGHLKTLPTQDVKIPFKLKKVK